MLGFVFGLAHFWDFGWVCLGLCMGSLSFSRICLGFGEVVAGSSWFSWLGFVWVWPIFGILVGPDCPRLLVLSREPLGIDWLDLK